MLLHIAESWRGETEVAEDLTSEVFRKCIKHLQNYDVNVAKLNTWLYHIAKNVVIDHHRTEHADRYLNTDDYVDDKGKPMFEQQTSIQADDNMMSEESRKNIAEAFRSLSAKQRKIATMFFLRKLSHEEICAALDIPLGTVKATINRCKTKLREQLQSLRQTA
ncbi:MAG: sigma-70 family RNA polymerase sigma factor [Candidatus Saccharibacteria bacterium]|nr:sigma-70 family RNA polymerase sigma factor [Candidatus Saccharibacteria bacterium]